MIRRPPRSTPFPTRRSSDLPKIDDPVGRRAGWHLIGHLQRNKAKLVPGRFVLVQSVDSLALAEELDRRGAGVGGAPGGVVAGDGGGGAAESGGGAGGGAGAGPAAG